MRLVTWNVHANDRAKWPYLAALRPDVAVLREVRREPPARFDLSFLGWEWAGVNKGVGVGVTAARCQPLPLIDSGTFSVAVLVGELPVVGVWSCPSDSTYYDEVRATVEACSSLLRDRPGVMAGDFNLIPKVAGAGSDFDKVQARLAELDYVSVYHENFGEPFGEETRPTHYHQYSRAKPFHIDFCFIARQLLPLVQSVEIGTYAEYVERRISDHVPLVVDLALDLDKI